MRRIKIAQIGTNTFSHSGQIFRGLAKRSDIFELVGYALPENERERLPHRMADFAGYPELSLDEILNDPTIEAVTIETDEIYTTKYALMAIEKGKCVHMEKPGGRNLSDFEKLISTVRERNSVFHIGYMYRYNPVVQSLISRIREGELGEIISVDAQMSCYHEPRIRAWLSELPGGMMFFLGCHLIDLILQIKGDPDKIIPFNRSTGTDGISSTDFGMAVLEYKNGVSTVKTTDIERGGYMRRQLVVTGTKGTAEICPLEYGPENRLISHERVFKETAWLDPGVSSVSEQYDRYDNMLESFAAMVRGEKQNPFTPEYELNLYRHLLVACGVKID